MDDHHFDRIARWLGAATSRRQGIRRALAVAVGAAVLPAVGTGAPETGAQSLDPEASIKRCKQHCQRQHEGKARRRCKKRCEQRCEGCPTGQTCCAGTCVDEQTDSANCGACGTACEIGDYCVAGVCSPCPTACPNDYPYCVDGICIMCRTTADCPGVTTCANTACCGAFKWTLNFGTLGSGDGNFNLPAGIDVVPLFGTMVAAVADGAANPGNQRVPFWGRTKGVWGQDYVLDGQPDITLVLPYDVAVSLVYGVHVLDTGSSQVVVLDQFNNVRGTYGSYGSEPDEFNAPRGIFLDEANARVYVADYGNNRVSVWTVNRTGASGVAVHLGNFGESGSGEGELNGPYDVAVGPDGRIFVADSGNSRISVWEHDRKDGKDRWRNVDAFGSDGSGNDQFNSPFGVDVASDGRVYVADTANQRFSIWAEKETGWENLAVYGTIGSGDGEFANPFRIAVEAAATQPLVKQDTVWVVDTGNSRVSVWTYDPSCGP